MVRNARFAQLFRKYRLRAEFKTLTEFVNALADEGLIYDESLLSRWQNGDRVPGDRNLWLIIIKIFAQKKAITTADEANNFLESGNQGYLTKPEVDKISIISPTKTPFFVPCDLGDFTGRDSEIDAIAHGFKSGKNIFVIHGIAGVGKTALAIRLANLLKEDFPNGVLWFRVDICSSGKILDTIAQTFNEDTSRVKNLEIKSSMVRSILSTKKVLLIFDNAESINQLHALLPNSPCSLVLITTQNRDLGLMSSVELVGLSPFNKNTVLSLCAKILGKDYARKNKKYLLQIGKILGNLPLAISISAKQMRLLKQNAKVYLEKLRKQENLLETLEYENKNLFLSFSLGFKHLNINEKCAFLASAIFAGRDFSSEAISYICNFSRIDAVSFLDHLVSKSLVERSSQERYRMHPCLRLYGEKNIFDKMLYKKAAAYCEKFLSKGRRGNLLFYPSILTEFENILSIFNKCRELKFWASLINLWEYFGVYLWDKGYWEKMNELGDIVYEATIKSHDDYSRAKICIRELCWLYFWQGDLDKSERYAFEGLDLAKKLKDDYLMAFARSRLGKINQAKKNFAEALRLFQQALAFFEKMGDEEKVGDILTYLGQTYLIMNRKEPAETTLKKALKFIEKTNDMPQKVIALTYLGGVFLLKEQYAKSISLFKQSLELAKRIGRKAGERVWNNLAIGLAYELSGDKKNAVLYFKKTKSEMEFLGMSNQILCTYELFISLNDKLKKSLFYSLSSHSP